MEVDGIDIGRFEGGKGVEHWGVMDAMGLMMQIGAIPAGASRRRRAGVGARVRVRPLRARDGPPVSLGAMSVAARPLFAFDNSFVRELEGLYEPWQAAPAPAPRLLALNEELAAELGVDADALRAPDGVAVLAGNAAPDGRVAGRAGLRRPPVRRLLARASATAGRCCSARCSTSTGAVATCTSRARAARRSPAAATARPPSARCCAST